MTISRASSAPESEIFDWRGAGRKSRSPITAECTGLIKVGSNAANGT